MVNVVREPNPTPVRPRVSSGASTALSRSETSGDTSTISKSRIPRLTATSTVKKRAPLGEISDNVDITSSQQLIRPRPIGSKSTGKAVLIKTRVTKSQPSVNAPQGAGAVLLVSTVSRTSSPPIVVGDETQLLDTTIEDLPGLSETDASDGEDPNHVLRQLLRKDGRVYQPTSQELSQAKAPQPGSHPTYLPISHLPTPPPSQTSLLATPPRSLLSQRRPRPSVTPPRSSAHASSSQSTLLSPAQITEPSPNPRRKKTPRAYHEGDGASIVDPQPSSKGRRKSRPSQPQSKSASHSTTPPAVQAPSTTARSKPRTSRSRKSIASPTMSTPKQTPRTSRKSIVGVAGDLPKSAQSLTPAGKKLVRAGGSALLKRALRATPGEDPLLLLGWEDDARTGRHRNSSERGTEAQDTEEDVGEALLPSRDKGKGRSIVFPSPPPNSDQHPAEQSQDSVHQDSGRQKSLSRFVANPYDPLADDSVEYQGGFYDDGFASASDAGDDDDNGVAGNDTFYHVRARHKQVTDADSAADVDQNANESPTNIIPEELLRCTKSPGDSAPIIASDTDKELEVSFDACGSSFSTGGIESEDLSICKNPTPTMVTFDAVAEFPQPSPPSVDDVVPLTRPSPTIPAASARLTDLAPHSSPAIPFRSPIVAPISPSTKTSVPLNNPVSLGFFDYVAPLAGGEETEEEVEGSDGEEAASSEHEQAADGDVTLEGLSDNWDVSTESAPPVGGDISRSTGSAPTSSAIPSDISMPQSDLLATEVRSQELDISTEGPAEEGESSWEEEESLEDREIEENSAEDEALQLADLAASLSTPAASEIAAPERIVLRIIPKGIVKVEPSPETELESAPRDTRCTEDMSEAAGAAQDLNEKPAPSADNLELSVSQSLPTPPTAVEQPSTPERSLIATPSVSTTPLVSPPPATLLPLVRRSPDPPSLVNRIERTSVKSSTTKVPSKLSQQFTAESPDKSPAHDSCASTSSIPQAEPSPVTMRRRLAGESSILTSTTKPTMLADTAAEDGDTSLSSVIEISSLDPRAAARAAAILKMNHAYIERGEMSNSRNTPRHSRRRSLHTSQHFETVEASRMVSKEELLLEAELEIASNHGRARSMSAASNATGISQGTAMTDLHLPGAWQKSPKRKRQQASCPTSKNLELELRRSAKASSHAWTVKDWKRLEKAFIAEKKAWIQEREVRQMPGGFTSWATRSFRAPESVKEWNPERVVKRFLEEADVSEGSGQWASDAISLRVTALERRVAEKIAASTSDDLAREQPSPKKRRQDVLETPARAALESATPTTLSRVFGFLWSPWAGNPEATGAQASVVAPFSQHWQADALDGSVRAKGKHRAQPAMQEIRPNLPTQPPATALHQTQAVRPAMVEGAIKTGAEDRFTDSISLRAATSTSRVQEWAQTVPKAVDPVLSSSLPAASAPAYSSPRIYPPLPSITQRSTALKALFPAIHPLNDSTSSTASAASSSSARSQPISIPKRSSSIQDLVNSFEDAKALERILEIRKSQSSSSLSLIR